MTTTNIAQVLGCESNAAAATSVSTAIVLRFAESTGSATTRARLATKSVCANAFVSAPSVIIQAVIGMAWYQTTPAIPATRSDVARTIIQYTNGATAASQMVITTRSSARRS